MFLCRGVLSGWITNGSYFGKWCNGASWLSFDSGIMCRLDCLKGVLNYCMKKRSAGLLSKSPRAESSGLSSPLSALLERNLFVSFILIVDFHLLIFIYSFLPCLDSLGLEFNGQNCGLSSISKGFWAGEMYDSLWVYISFVLLCAISSSY